MNLSRSKGGRASRTYRRLCACSPARRASARRFAIRRLFHGAATFGGFMRLRAPIICVRLLPCALPRVSRNSMSQAVGGGARASSSLHRVVMLGLAWGRPDRDRIARRKGFFQRFVERICRWLHAGFLRRTHDVLRGRTYLSQHIPTDKTLNAGGFRAAPAVRPESHGSGKRGAMCGRRAAAYRRGDRVGSPVSGGKRVCGDARSDTAQTLPESPPPLLPVP